MLGKLFHRQASQAPVSALEPSPDAIAPVRPDAAVTVTASPDPPASTSVLGQVSLQPTYSWGSGPPPGPCTPDLQRLNAGLPWQERAANISREVEAIGIRPGDPVRVSDVYGDSCGIFRGIVPDTGSLDYEDRAGPRGDDLVLVQKIDTASYEQLQQPTRGVNGEVRVFAVSKVHAIGFDRQGSRIAAGGEVDGATAVRVFDAETGLLVLHVTVAAETTRVVFSPDGSWLATTERSMRADENDVWGWHHCVRVFDVSDGAELAHADDARLGGFSPDGRTLVTVTPTDVVVRGVPSGEELLRIPAPGDVAVFDPGGDRIIVVHGVPPTLQAFDARTGEAVPWSGPDLAEGWQAPFSQNGTRLLTFDVDAKTASVWDTITGVELLRIVHEAAVWDAAFAVDGLRLATASGSTTDPSRAHVWDATSGEEQVRVELFGERAVAFSPDGSRLATDGDLGGQGVRGLHLWDVTG